MAATYGVASSSSSSRPSSSGQGLSAVGGGQSQQRRPSARALVGTSRIDQENDSPIILHNVCAAVDLGVAFNDQQLGHIAQNCRNCEHKGHKVDDCLIEPPLPSSTSIALLAQRMAGMNE
jgi:hypothetical protein